MKKLISIIASVFLFATMVAAQVTDKDGKSYKTVSIDSKIWMADNLSVTHFRNGNLIPNVKTNDEWEKAFKEQKPAWCFYNFDPTMGDKYGILYNGYAVLDKRGLAPVGWHVSTDEEWTGLTTFLGIHDAGKKLKATSGWSYYGGNGSGTNESGFNALAAGFMMYYGNFIAEGTNAYFWTSTTFEDNIVRNHYYRSIDPANSLDVVRGSQSSGNGSSVRCVKD